MTNGRKRIADFPPSSGFLPWSHPRAKPLSLSGPTCGATPEPSPSASPSPPVEPPPNQAPTAPPGPPAEPSSEPSPGQKPPAPSRGPSSGPSPSASPSPPAEPSSEPSPTSPSGPSTYPPHQLPEKKKSKTWKTPPEVLSLAKSEFLGFMVKNKHLSVPGKPEPRPSDSSLQLRLLNALSNLSMQILDENFRPSIRILRRMLSIVKIIYRHLEKLLQQAQQKK